MTMSSKNPVRLMGLQNLVGNLRKQLCQGATVWPPLERVEKGKCKYGKLPRSKKEGLEAIYQVNCEVERNRFADVSRGKDWECEGLKKGKRMVKTNQDIPEQSLRNGMVYQW